MAEDTRKNILEVDVVQSIDKTDTVLVNDNNSLKQVSVETLISSGIPDQYVTESELTGKGYATTASLPTKTSDLTNNSGFITDDDIPEKLPNPQKIIFTGAVTAEYDGSSEQTVHIPESSGGDSYTLPIMSDTQLGGGKAVSKTDEDVPVAVDTKTGQLFVPTYPVQGGITEEQKQQLEQNTQDITDLKSAINEKWTDISPGEIFEISTNSNDNAYKLEGLEAYFDFTKYPDGYSGDLEDLSGNNTEIVLFGLDLYESGRNGFVNGKLMINSGPLSNSAGSRASIKSEAIHMYPFSIEIYAHLRRDYNAYAGNGVLNYTSTDALKNHQATVFSTQYNTTDGAGATNGVKVMINKENVSISGSASSPNVSKNVPGLEIDGIQNENIGDRYDHIVVCFDLNKQKFYLNNELIIDNDEKSVSLTMSSVLRILPDQLKGDIKLIRIYEGMLSDDDVAMNYSNAVGGIENEI